MNLRLPLLVLIVLLSAPSFIAAQADCTGVAGVAHSGLKSVVVAESIDLSDPLLALSPPGDTDRLFIVGQDGRVWIHRRGAAASDLQLFLDIRSKVNNFSNEQGLLGMAFDPDFSTTGDFWVNYTESDNPFFGPHFTVVARYSLAPGDPDLADPTSEARVLRFAQPQVNHNAGQLLFDADGFLLIATGDGGGGGDQHGVCGNGQSLTSLLGKILRIDVRGIDPLAGPAECFLGAGDYTVPSTNPLADGAGGACDEIWAYGLRNPWRNDLDPLTGDFYAADVGQDCWEEVNVLPASTAAGANYGWRQMEGAHCFDNASASCDPASVACGSSPDCFDPSLVLPVTEYDHGAGCSITGGAVYRGCLMPDLRGRYFYGDYCSAFINSFVYSGGAATAPADHTAELDPGATLGNALTSFGRDGRGELMIIDRNGRVLKILPLFTDLVVSGDGAGTPFLLGADWSWEDVAFETEHPVDSYRVYRAQRPGTDPFTCVHRTAGPAPQWLGGDPAVPAPAFAFAYLVTAVSPTGEETADGHPTVSRTPGGCP